MDPDAVRVAVAVSNLPTMLMVLYQLTGDDQWLNDPYRPSRGRGLDDNDSGGFSDAAARVIRDAAVEAILAWDRGASPAVPQPRGELFLRMMRWSVGDAVPPSYVPMMELYMGFAKATPDVLSPATRTTSQFTVAIIGAGISGLLASLELREAGIRNFVVDRNPDVGGTWFENSYPGAGVDIPSFLYSFKTFPRAWATHYPKRDEVWQYLKDFADHFDLRSSLHLGVEIVSAEYNERAQAWTLEGVRRSGARVTMGANAVISAVGVFNTPKIPHIPGIASFDGPLFHSARWPSDLDVSGKRVAVIGTGASAMQIVPAIAGKVRQLVVLQRTPQWMAPTQNYFRTVGPGTQWLIDSVPYYREWYRFRLAWTWNDRTHRTLIRDAQWEHPERSINKANDRHREMFTRYLREQLAGYDRLERDALPSYPPFAKRLLIDNGWFTALKRPNVELIPAACAEITETSVRASTGDERDVDVIVMCTGFYVQHFLKTIEVRGRGGKLLRECWDEDDARAYLGITVPGFPNFFMMYGPSTNGAGGSFMDLAESQVGYIRSLLLAMLTRDIGAIEPRRDRFDEYNATMDQRHQDMIWMHAGVDTYFRNSRGRVVVNRPWRVDEYWHFLRRASIADYVSEPRTSS